MIEKVWIPPKERGIRHHTWSEFASYILTPREWEEYDSAEREPTVEDLSDRAAFGLIYGWVMHAFIKAITDDPGDIKDVGERLRQFWNKRFARGRNKKVADKARIEHATKGIKRGLKELEVYLSRTRNRPIIPREYATERGKMVEEGAEVKLERVKIQNSSFFLSVTFDQLREASSKYPCRKCIVDLKFSDCTWEEFIERWQPIYEVQMLVYAIAHIDYQVLMGLSPIEPVLCLYHIPSDKSISWVPSHDNLISMRLKLKKAEKRLSEHKGSVYRDKSESSKVKQNELQTRLVF